MNRDLYKQLLNWKSDLNRKPLILRGARQVGKTHLLKRFATQEYTTFVYLNFETDPKVAQLFSQTLKPSSIIENISLYINQTIHSQDTLIIFDEIQECPEALNSLKYFQEEAKEFHIVSAGSLLGVKLAKNKGFPVGKVNFLDLYPLSFFEFLEAIGKEKLRHFLGNIHVLEPIPGPIHEELLNDLKRYFFMGGMPEVVNEYLKNQDLLSIRKIQQEILIAYLLDFSKYAEGDQIMKITQVWENIPSQLAKEHKKFVFSALRKSARGREYETAIQWLFDAGLIHKSYSLSVTRLPLSGYKDGNAFKVFLLDVGLLSAMAKIPTKSLTEGNQLFSEFYGALTENFVAQSLAKHQYPLYYWTSSGVAEVDFVIEHELDLYPLEVKAGISRKKKSLLVYGNQYAPKRLLRTTAMNLKQDGNVCNIPLYLVDRLMELARLPTAPRNSLK